MKLKKKRKSILLQPQLLKRIDQERVVQHDLTTQLKSNQLRADRDLLKDL